jgi:hypothetical protein
MNKKTTVVWVCLAAALFAYIYMFERGRIPTQAIDDSTRKLLLNFNPEQVNELRVTSGRLFLKIQKTGNSWWIASPIKYPAHPVLIENLLKQIGVITREYRIESRSLKDFGLEEPSATVLIKGKDFQSELQIGNVTPDTAGIYVRLAGGDAVYVAPIELKQFIPDKLNDWRSRALVFSEKDTPFDRVEVRSSVRGIGFSIQHNPTNRTWHIIKPLQARADRTKVDHILMKLLSCRVSDFVSDDPQVDPDRYGLTTPEIELALGLGTNDLITIQFGKSPTNDPTQVYARIVEQKNVVLVNKDLFDSIHISFTELRERRLMNFAPETITEIAIRGAGAFTVQYQSNQIWKIVEPQEMIADNGLLSALVSDLLSIQAVDFEKDVVTDYAPYGLTQPLRQVIIKGTITNQGLVTNVVVAQLDFGTNGAGKFFARRPDESSVYAISELDYYKLPEAGWHLRNRQVWNFNLTNVTSITVSKGGAMYQIIRRGEKDWTLGAGSQGIVNKVGVERTVARLCALQANSWLARGNENRAAFGFEQDGYKIMINTKENNQFNTYILEIGGKSKSLSFYGAVYLDNQLWIFELPWVVADDIIKNLPPPQQVIPGS